MCRFLSKFILDTCCPVPFPMFLNRDAYLNALINGRKEAPTAAPLYLAKLLLDSAASYYRQMLSRYFQVTPFTKLIVAGSCEELTKECKSAKVAYNNIDQLISVFKEMSFEESRDITIEGEVYRLKKEEFIDNDIDSL